MAKGDPRYRAAIQRLADARRQAKLSQEELAEKLGRRQQYVSKYETGERRLDLIEYIDAAKALNQDIVQILKSLE